MKTTTVPSLRFPLFSQFIHQKLFSITGDANYKKYSLKILNHQKTKKKKFHPYADKLASYTFVEAVLFFHMSMNKKYQDKEKDYQNKKKRNKKKKKKTKKKDSRRLQQL